MSDSLLLIFVKHPIPGQVKTRLAATVGHDTALKVYQALLRFTCELAQELTVDKAVFYGNQIPDTDVWQEASFPRHLQQGPNLGSRMEHAFAWAFDQGYQKVVVIGSDCAHLTTDILRQAFDTLRQNDGVIGPALDGGYYLLGLCEAFPAVFQNKVWSTESVFPDTKADFERANKSLFQLISLSDVDHEEDLKGTFLEALLSEQSAED
ncbi:MAG: TIGR04282 family arsenosugar biosynthesis glycosyltransferase [Bacteroidota bacterium]